MIDDRLYKEMIATGITESIRDKNLEQLATFMYSSFKYGPEEGANLYTEACSSITKADQQWLNEQHSNGELDEELAILKYQNDNVSNLWPTNFSESQQAWIADYQEAIRDRDFPRFCNLSISLHRQFESRIGLLMTIVATECVGDTESFRWGIDAHNRAGTLTYLGELTA